MNIKLSRSQKANKKGFTIVELLLAVTFFSFILLFVSAGFIAINRQFVKGRITRQVQSDARLVVEDITRSLRDAGNNEIPDLSNVQTDKVMCFGDATYIWSSPNDASKNRYTNNRIVNLAKTGHSGGGTCNSDVTPEDSVELINSDTVVQYIGIEPYGGPNISGLYRVIVILSSDQDEIGGGGSGIDANCVNVLNSNTVRPEYCSVVNFQTIVNVRRNS